MSKLVSIDDKHWVYLFADLSSKDKRQLEGYYSAIYPREYVKKLIAALEEENVQSKEAGTSNKQTIQRQRTTQI